MKSIYAILLIFILGLISCNSTSGSLKTETFKVWGNCDKCKATIENAAGLDGVKEKNWNVESTLMTVKFDTTLVTLDAIEQAIAKSGYDNDGYYGDDYAYGKLEACCQYERKPFEIK